MPPDEALVRRFQRGDRAAFAELVHRYQDQVFASCLRWMRDRTEAEELAQDVFISVFRSLSKFRGDCEFSTWLFRVVVNHCKNRKIYRHRRAAGRHESLENDGDELGRQLVEPRPGAEAAVSAGEAARLIHKALGELDDRTRMIIHLRDLAGLSYDEISSAMEIPRGTVKSRLHRARAQLGRVLRHSVGHEDVL